MYFTFWFGSGAFIMMWIYHTSMHNTIIHGISHMNHGVGLLQVWFLFIRPCIALASANCSWRSKYMGTVKIITQGSIKSSSTFLDILHLTSIWTTPFLLASCSELSLWVFAATCNVVCRPDYINIHRWLKSFPQHQTFGITLIRKFRKHLWLSIAIPWLQRHVCLSIEGPSSRPCLPSRSGAARVGFQLSA